MNIGGKMMNKIKAKLYTIGLYYRNIKLVITRGFVLLQHLVEVDMRMQKYQAGIDSMVKSHKETSVANGKEAPVLGGEADPINYLGLNGINHKKRMEDFMNRVAIKDATVD